MSPALNLELDEPAAGSFRPGDWVRGRVNVVEGGNSRALTVVVRFLESTADYKATGATYGEAGLHQGELSAGASFTFAIQLPPDCFPSYQSAHGELYYEVQAKSDERGPDTHVERRIGVNTSR